MMPKIHDPNAKANSVSPWLNSYNFLDKNKKLVHRWRTRHEGI